MLDNRRSPLGPMEEPFPNEIAEVLESFVSTDGTRRAEVYRRHDGFFGYCEEVLRDDEYAGPYWSPALTSGIYSTHAEAIRDARAEIAWIRDSLT